MKAWRQALITGVAVTMFGVAFGLGLGPGCGRSDDASEASTPSLPPEVRAQMAALEEAMNQRLLDRVSAVYDEKAQVQVASLLGYAGKAQMIEAMRGSAPSRITFGETEVVSVTPTKVRAITEVVRQQGDARTAEKVFFEWIRVGDAWLIKEQSFPDWSPLVGVWCRDEDPEQVTLRLHPSGNVEMTMTESKVPVRRGAFSGGTESFSLVPDATGAGATGEGRLEYAFKFEFDGSLGVSLTSGREKDGVPSVAGSWKRCAIN